MIVRLAIAEDAETLAELIAEGLDHHIPATTIRANLARLDSQALPQLVAEQDGKVVGLAGLHRMDTIYRPKPVGRITILVVARNQRGHGVGRALVDHAVAIARDWGCGMIEVTSNERWTDAHAFYRHLGWDQTSRRFALGLE